jgi:GTP cyclohydrolase II
MRQQADKQDRAQGLAPTLLQRVERAQAELRRGLAVLITADKDATIALAAESATRGVLEALCKLGAPNILLTIPRARTLKIRLYTGEAVALPWTPDMDVATIRQLADPTLDLANPLSGPFRASRDPLPQAASAVLALLKGAGLLPAALIVSGRAVSLAKAARAARLLSVSTQDVMSYAGHALARTELIARAQLPLQGIERCEVVAFRSGDGGPEQLALVVEQPDLTRPVLVRLHSACFTGDLLGSLRCDCGDQLRESLRGMAAQGGGILLYLAQEGRGIGLLNKLRAYSLQEQGFDTMEANERLGFAFDERVFETASAILRSLGVTKVRLLTNNPNKIEKLRALGIEVVERIPIVTPANEHNRRYLEAKAKSGHSL